MSSVTSLSWGHPEFGQLLATAGTDGIAFIWEERAESAGPLGDAAAAQRGNNHAKWKERKKFADARKAVTCIKFAPKHLRLQIAMGSADGSVRIYEAVDPLNLESWSSQQPSIKVESDTSSDLGVTCLDWCSGRFEPPTLVVGDSSGNVSVYRYSDASKKWGPYLKLDGHVSPRKGVLDVAWAPDVGRSYHLISSCGRDGILRVHRLKKAAGSADGDQRIDAASGGSLQLEPSQLLDSESESWRCAWNVTGTVLASSGDTGVVKLWKSNFQGTWKCVADVHGTVRDQAAVPMAPS